MLLYAQVSKAHVTNVVYKFTFSQESLCRVTGNRWDWMRNKILRSANAKYHYCYLFFYKIKKKETYLLMYSCVFLIWIHRFSRIFNCYCLTPFEKKKKKATQPVRAHRSWRHQVFNLWRALELPSHELLPTVNRTRHFDRFFSLRPDKKEDARNGGKTHENEAILLGSRRLVSMNFNFSHL